MKYEVFEPFVEPTHVVIMGSILAGKLHGTNGREGDHAYRARYIAEHSTAAVIAYERPTVRGERRIPTVMAILGRQLARCTDRYALPVVLAGASAAGLSTLELAVTKTIPAAHIATFDPVGQQLYTKKAAAMAWLSYQMLDEKMKPPGQKNQNPMSKDFPWTQLDGLSQIAATTHDLRHNNSRWRTPRSLNLLSAIALDSDFDDVSVLTEVPGHTFSMSPETAIDIVNALNALPDDNRPAPFSAVYSADKYHSWPDDPARFAAIIDNALKLAS